MRSKAKIEGDIAEKILHFQYGNTEQNSASSQTNNADFLTHRMLTNNEKKSGNLAFILRQYRTDHDSAVTATSAHTISINMIAP